MFVCLFSLVGQWQPLLVSTLSVVLCSCTSSGFSTSGQACKACRYLFGHSGWIVARAAYTPTPRRANITNNQQSKHCPWAKWSRGEMASKMSGGVGFLIMRAFLIFGMIDFHCGVLVCWEVLISGYMGFLVVLLVITGRAQGYFFLENTTSGISGTGSSRLPGAQMLSVFWKHGPWYFW